jgi:hypothetical protein
MHLEDVSPCRTCDVSELLRPNPAPSRKESSLTENALSSQYKNALPTTFHFGRLLEATETRRHGAIPVSFAMRHSPWDLPAASNRDARATSCRALAEAFAVHPKSGSC